MRKYLFALFFLISSNLFSQPVSVTFELDMTLYSGNFSTVEFYRGGQSYPMTNNGNIYEYTVNVPPFQTTNYTYKFKVDGALESFVGNETCIVVTPSLDTLRTINLNSDTTIRVCWQSCNQCVTSIFGCIDSAANNYNSLANVDNDSCEYNITFFVDMSESSHIFDTVEVNGTFNSWCGSCAQMTDTNNDNIWSVTVPLMNGDYDYKFSADNWNIEEDLFESDDCIIGSPPFINRSLSVTGNHILDTVCWNRCYSCDIERNFYNVTFQLDMTNVTDQYTFPEVNGTFNNWCGNCWPLENQGNNIYSSSFNVDTSLHFFKFSADNWSIQEELDSNLSCILINYDSTATNGWGQVNRFLNFSNDTILNITCWMECDSCETTIDSTWNCYQSAGCQWAGSNPSFQGPYSSLLDCQNNCNNTSTVLTSKDNNISVYPNPSNGFFNILSKLDLDKIIIYNMLGSKLLEISNPAPHTEVDLTFVRSDFYYIEIFSNNNIIREKILNIR
jgi:hypothetical protein